MFIFKQGRVEGKAFEQKPYEDVWSANNINTQKLQRLYQFILYKEQKNESKKFSVNRKGRQAFNVLSTFFNCIQ